MQGVIIGSIVMWRCFLINLHVTCYLAHLLIDRMMIFLWKSRSRGKHLWWKQRKQEEGIRIKKKKKKKGKERRETS